MYFNITSTTFYLFYSQSNNTAKSDFEDFSGVWREFEYGHKLQRYITLLHKFSFSKYCVCYALFGHSINLQYFPLIFFCSGYVVGSYVLVKSGEQMFPAEVSIDCNFACCYCFRFRFLTCNTLVNLLHILHILNKCVIFVLCGFYFSKLIQYVMF